MKRIPVRVLATFGSLLLLCSQLMAAPITFYGNNWGAAITHLQAEAAFQQALSVVYFEDFEASPDIDFGNGVTGALSAGRIVTSASSAIDGVRLWQTGHTGNLTISFNVPIFAFGIFMGDVDQGVDMHALINNYDFNIPNPVGGSYDGDRHFWGVVSPEESFTQVTFTDLDWYINWDRAQMGIPASGPTPTPEPSTIFLLFAGLCSLLLIQRHIKASRQGH
ncbi:PEP-CTERM sorting domain-containing protein [Oleidesulfovibrio sp.]|uniref:PEP-CTERM sorting domain-containing protein n=1 Tax=Oleidesulfovibrio sp. TaxID=2909707 RepID=UPI003A8789B3